MMMVRIDRETGRENVSSWPISPPNDTHCQIEIEETHTEKNACLKVKKMSQPDAIEDFERKNLENLVFWFFPTPPDLLSSSFARG